MGDALTKGMGTPWGPMESGRPSTPNYDAYATDPGQFAGFDFSPQAAAAKNAIALGGGDAARAYQAQSARMLGNGTTEGASNGRLANIAAQTEKNQNESANQFALQGYQSQMQQMDAYNRAKQLANSLKEQQYGTDMGAYNQEANQRGQAIGALTGGLAGLAGKYLGRNSLGQVADPQAGG